MTNIIENLLSKKHLSYTQMQDIMHGILHGTYSSEWIAAFLVAMRSKGIIRDELLAAAEVMQKLVTKVPILSNNVIDVVGTGGDGINTFNISTASMFVAAGAGAKVAKHGNRGVSSKSGSADALEALGIPLNLTVEQICFCIDELGLGFMFAPHHHPSMKYVAPVRKALGIRTFFNILGPLTNPANVKRMLMGVYDENLLKPIAEVLLGLGFEHAWVVCAENGMDEISTCFKTHVYEVKNQEIQDFYVQPEDFGFKKYDIEILHANSPEHSASIIQSVLYGTQGAAFDIVCINAGALLYISDMAASLEDGIQKAKQSIMNGAALKKLHSLVNINTLT
jgi:anthranilate phosphoribosyltransferase